MAISCWAHDPVPRSRRGSQLLALEVFEVLDSAVNGPAWRSVARTLASSRSTFFPASPSWLRRPAWLERIRSISLVNNSVRTSSQSGRAVISARMAATSFSAASLDSHTGDSPKSRPPGRVALVGC